MYGIAQASTAYLVTKITDPPPPPEQSFGFAEKQITWTNKHEFLQLSLDRLDAFNAQHHHHDVKGESSSHDVSPSPEKVFS